MAALFAPDTASSVSEALSAANHGQRLSLSDLRLQGADGEGIPVELTLRRVRHPGGCDVVAVARDLRSKQALGQSERAIQDLGRLARTVRALNHEINNPLTCIIGLTQLMQLRLKDLPDYLPQLDRILDSAEQINDLSKRLREIAVVLGGEQSLQAIEAVLHDLPASTGT